MAVVKAGLGFCHAVGDAAEVVVGVRPAGELVDDDVESLAADRGVGSFGEAVAHVAGFVGVGVDAAVSEVAVEIFDFNPAVFGEFP